MYGRKVNGKVLASGRGDLTLRTPRPPLLVLPNPGKKREKRINLIFLGCLFIREYGRKVMEIRTRKRKKGKKWAAHTHTYTYTHTHTGVHKQVGGTRLRQCVG